MAAHICISISKSIYIYMMPFQMENGKLKPRRFSLICLLFAHHTNESLSFVRYPFLNGLKGLAHLCLYAAVGWL